MALLEVACFSPDNALLAANAGADRIELCDDPGAGGTTPPLQWLAQIRPHVTIPVFVMIRPRGGDFVYSGPEMELMRTAIDAFKPNADGFVFGILDADRRVDVARTAELVRRAHPLPCTFHRAFDDAVEPFQAFEDVLATGCRAILSSGGATSAAHGTEVLSKLVKQAKTSVTIIPGGGVRSKNIARIKALTHAFVFHSAAVQKGSTRPCASEIRRMKEHIQALENGVVVDEREGALTDDESEGQFY